MKKKFLAVIIAAALIIACVPLFSGCSAKVVYSLGEDEEGKYYIAGFSGFPNGLKGELVIPEEHDGLPVKEIAAEGFAGTAITGVTIPKTVKKIGTAAFAYNYSLKTVTFADGCAIDEIAQGMFGYCSSLTEISVPSTVTVIDPMAFTNCTSLATVNLSDKVELIGAMAFAGCTSLRQIDLPDGLKTIGEQAFYTTGLTSVVIPDSVKDITVEEEDGEGNKVTRAVYGIGCDAFHTCVDMKYAVIGGGVDVIHSGAFGYCTSLEKIYLPKGLTKIEGNIDVYKHAFHHNKVLTEVYYGGTQEEWEELVKNVGNVTVTEKGESYDNSAIINAQKHYNVSAEEFLNSLN